MTQNQVLLFANDYCNVNHVHSGLATTRVVIKSRGPRIFRGYKESGPWLLLLENRTKIEPKEIPSRLIPRLLVVFTRQLEILVTTPNDATKLREKFSQHCLVNRTYTERPKKRVIMY